MITTRTLVVLICFAAIISGCSSAPLVPVAYDKEVIVQSDLAAFVELTTGRVTGAEGRGYIVAGVRARPGIIPELHFRAEDQAKFIDSLKTELQRHGIVGFISDTATNDTLAINVNFVQTEHLPAFQEYKLTVSLIATHGDLEVGSRYEVLSSEGDSGWEKNTTSAAEGKEKAAAKLMDLILTDIQEFVLQIEGYQPDSP